MVLFQFVGGGSHWALVDLLIKNIRQPKRSEPDDLTARSHYPLVPEMIKPEDDLAKRPY